MTLERLRSWSSHSPLFARAWGFGLILLLFALLISLFGWITTALEGPIHRLQLVAALWGLLSNSLAIFVAGIAAYSFIAPRAANPIVRAVLLAGLTFVFFYPLAAVGGMISWIIWLQEDIGVERLYEDFLNHWWNNLDQSGLRFLLAIACASVLFLWLPRSGTIGQSTADEARERVLRYRDLLVGALILVVGLVLAFLTWVGLVYEVQKVGLLADENPQWAPQLRPWAEYLQRELWSFVLWRSMPFVIVGTLLLATSLPRSRAQ
jgi:hypothetical protein